MAGAALVVGGAGVASADELAKSGTVSGSTGNKLEFKRTISSGEVTYGDTVTITSEIVDSTGITWWANTHSWIENNTERCLQYVPGSAEWRAWPRESFENPLTKPGEFKPSENVIRAQFPVVVSDPLVLKADYVVLCNAGDEVATGGMSWKGTYGSSGGNYTNFGPTIKVNRASVNEFFLRALDSAEAGKPTTLSVSTTAPDGSKVVFEVDGQTLNATVGGGAASAEWTPSSSGTKQLKATLLQTGTHLGKTATRTISVAEEIVGSEVVIDAPANAEVGEATRLAASVTPTGSGGTVTFKEEGVVIDEVSVPANGIAEIEWIPSAAGDRSIDAEFSGRPGVNASNAIGRVVNVQPASIEKQSSVTELDPIAMTQLGETVTLRAKVNPAEAGGTVTFYDGGVRLGEVAVGADGVATFEWTTTTEGQRTIRAVYSGTDKVLSSQDTTRATITAATNTPDPEEPNEPEPDEGTGSLGSLTGSGGGGNASGSLGSLSSFGS